MGYYKITPNYTVDFNYGENNRIRVLETQKEITRKPARLLYELINAKLKGIPELYFDDLVRLKLYTDEKESIKESLIKLRDQIYNAFGEGINDYDKVIKIEDNYNRSCILLTYTPESVIDETDYYYKLWNNHVNGEKDTVDKKELIDYFNMPKFKENNSDESVLAPFEQDGFKVYISANSGYGKSTLLHMVILLMINDIVDKRRIADVSGGKKYRELKKKLFGDNDEFLFPIYIDSSRANEMKYDNILQLADNGDDCFVTYVESLYRKKKKILFLIDSLDEIENAHKDGFYTHLKRDIIEKFGESNILMVSRFIGDSGFGNYVHLNLIELTEEGIEKIVGSYLQGVSKSRLLKVLKEHDYVYSLARNPFILRNIIEIGVLDWNLYDLLKSITSAMINKKWNAERFGIEQDEIMILLGYLACKTIIGQKDKFEKKEIKKCFDEAQNMLINNNCIEYEITEAKSKEYIDKLSSQSGILNIRTEKSIDMYVFQDKMIMCWLAANFIIDIINNSDSIIASPNGYASVVSNTGWFWSLINSFAKNNEVYVSKELISTIVLAFVGSEAESQKFIAMFLFIKEMVTVDKEEKKNICEGINMIRNDTYGSKDIANIEDGYEAILRNGHK